MNDNNVNNGSFENKYRATRNLNTSLETPQFNAGDTLDVNLKKVDNNVQEVDYGGLNNQFYSNEVNVSNNNDIGGDGLPNVVNTNTNLDNNNFINAGGSNNSYVNNVVLTNNNINNYDELTPVEEDKKISYKPAVSRKKKKISFGIPSELRILIILVVIILVYIYIIPNIYDFFREIKLTIFG